MASYLLNLMLLTGVAFLLAFWWKTAGIKQIAFQAAQRRCDELGVQLLDQSIMLRGLSLRRGGTGRLMLMRRFVFEFSSTGNERYRGEVRMLGRRLHGVDLEPHRI